MSFPPEFTDKDSETLLELLDRYCRNYAPDLPQTIPALAEDLLHSHDDSPGIMLIQLANIQGLYP